MPYESPVLTCKNREVAAVIAMATDEHLKQAHYLLAARYPGDSPNTHFGRTATVMILLTIAAASALRTFNPQRNNKIGGDKKCFVDCVEQFFPWTSVSIKDGQHRSKADHPNIAATELYTSFRNPLVHSGGMVGTAGVAGKDWRKAQIWHPLPGLATPEENDNTITEWCKLESLSGQTLLSIEFDHSVIHTKTLYWCTRKMIEAFAADPTVESEIIKSLGIKSQITVRRLTRRFAT